MHTLGLRLASASLKYRFSCFSALAHCLQIRLKPSSWEMELTSWDSLRGSKNHLESPSPAMLPSQEGSRKAEIQLLTLREAGISHPTPKCHNCWERLAAPAQPTVSHPHTNTERPINLNLPGGVQDHPPLEDSLCVSWDPGVATSTQSTQQAKALLLFPNSCLLGSFPAFLKC